MKEIKISKIEVGDPLFEEYPNANKLELEQLEGLFDAVAEEICTQLEEILKKHNVEPEKIKSIMGDFLQ